MIQSCRPLAVFVSTAALVLQSQVARSEPAPIDLVWDAPRECPDAAYVLSEATRLAGQRSFARTVRARGVATISSGGFQVDLTTETEGNRGHRVLNAPTCLSLADATAMILALVLNPESGRQPPSADWGPAERGAPPSRTSRTSLPPAANGAAVPVEPARVTARRGRSRRPGIGFDLFGAAVLMRLPSASLTMGGSLSLQAGPIELGLLAAYAPGQDITDGSGVTATFDTWSAGVRGCWLPRVARVAIGSCLGGESVWVTGDAKGQGITSTRQTAQWFESWLGPRALGDLGLWVFGATAELGVPWKRQVFFVDGGTWERRVGAVLLRLSLSAGLRF